MVCRGARTLSASVFLAVCINLAISIPLFAQSTYTLVQFPDANTPAYDVNDAATVVGFGTNHNDGDRGYIWTRSGGMQPIIPAAADKGKFPCAPDFPRNLRINNAGTIAGKGSVNGCGGGLKGDHVGCHQRPGHAWGRR